MKNFVFIFVVSVFLAIWACQQNLEDATETGRASKLRFIQEARSCLCFAVGQQYGRSTGGPIYTTVPCERVGHLLEIHQRHCGSATGHAAVVR